MLGILVTSFLLGWPVFKGYVCFSRRVYSLHVFGAFRDSRIPSEQKTHFVSAQAAEIFFETFGCPALFVSAQVVHIFFSGERCFAAGLVAVG